MCIDMILNKKKFCFEISAGLPGEPGSPGEPGPVGRKVSEDTNHIILQMGRGPRDVGGWET